MVGACSQLLGKANASSENYYIISDSVKPALNIATRVYDENIGSVFVQSSHSWDGESFLFALYLHSVAMASVL